MEWNGNNLTYLLIIDNYLWQFYGIRPLNQVVGTFSLQGLECYTDK